MQVAKITFSKNRRTHTHQAYEIGLEQLYVL